jgi:hypothetical protein
MPMPIATTQALHNAQAGFLADYTVLANQLIDTLVSLLARYTVNDSIPLSRLQEVQNAAQDATLRLYVDPERGGYAADGITPLAPYTSALNRHIIAATVGVVTGHSRWLNQRPADVVSWMQLGSTRQLPTYDPFHKWIDPRGWTLSDRVWQTGLDARRKIGEYMDYHIRNGTSALKMAKDLRPFLVPNEALKTTNMPYGTTVSYSGMRLGRTEIARAHTEASFAAAMANPYVTGMDWRLSARHPKFDICDGLATIGMSGQRLKDPYPLESAPHVVEDSHPQCCLPGQMINTTLGSKAIETVEAGEFVLTHAGKYQRVLKSWSYEYRGDVYQITTSNGDITITPEHPVLTQRGWINAELLQVGDQILYAPINTGIDSGISKTENLPSETDQFGIPNVIPFGVVPVNPIAFNVDLSRWMCEIEIILANAILAFKAKANLLESVSHLDLNTGGTQYPLSTHLDQSGIAKFLSIRNLLSYFGALCGIIFTHHVITRKLCHAFTNGNAARSVIMQPLTSYAFTSVSEWDIATGKQIAEISEIDVEAFTDFGCSKPLNDVKIIQNILQRKIELFFNSLSMFVEDISPSTFLTGFPPTGITTDAARHLLFWHNDLLLSSPDIEGHGSGNPSVITGATRDQAHNHYSTITAICAWEYAGFVYNMHVENDNSYALNGAFVHNCICVNSPALGDVAAITTALREQMAQGNTPSGLIPINIQAFLIGLLGTELALQIYAELQN